MSGENIISLATEELVLDITSAVPPLLPTEPEIISEADSYGINEPDSDLSSPVSREGIIIVANMLPLNGQKDKTGKWSFSLDEDSLLLQMKDGFSSDSKISFVGCLEVEVDVTEQDEVAQKLLEEFNCVPTFLPTELQKRFYHGFCKQQLWPLFHYMLPMCSDQADRFDRALWKAYVSVNKIFADKVMEVVNPDDDYVWIHDYHLMLLPTFLRKHYNRAKIGFFLHSPFPSSEIYRTLPVRNEILKGLLNCDLIGFHTFDYARHFLSCCSRMLGLNYESKRGNTGIDYFGRTIYIKILPVGIHMGRLESVLNLQSTSVKVKEILEKFKGKKLILGIDDMDIFKGISLKLLAFEHLLNQYEEFRGKLVLVQIVNPARSLGKDVIEAKREAYSTVERINRVYGAPDYNPVILLDRPVPRYEKTAYYLVAECCIVNAVRDGMNLVPYEYIICRQGFPDINESDSPPRTSMLVVSEFIGCSPSLSGAIRVNPWDTSSVAEAIYSAMIMPEAEKQMRHEKHYKYVSSHDVCYWVHSFVQDMERACKDHYSKRFWGIGLGLGFRVVSLSPSFRKLSLDQIASAYKRSNKRAIFLDYDGTLIPQSRNDKAPSRRVVTALDSLCSDPKNTVFIVSGRGRDTLSEWLANCEDLGLAAEHGYFIRWSENGEWKSSELGVVNLEWMEIVLPIMKQYTEATDGSSIEIKESGLVWHHQDADPDFGSCQAKELLDHLENVLANEPAVVKRGHHIVEVKPQGVSKGLVAEKILSEILGKDGECADFVMCIGDDRSDEDMFERCILSTPAPAHLFACTVGQKPSKAKYYLDDTADVVTLLHGLADSSTPSPSPSPTQTAQFHVSFS